MTDAKRTKTVDVSIEVEASAEAVWEAISDAEELRRWFPLDAEVEPGEGGSMTISWGPDAAGTGRIDVWEEGQRLRVVEEWPGADEAVEVAVDYRIESRGGTTVLRIVNSGFQAGDDWAEYVDTVTTGWQYFLWNLKHYLERHRGTPRRMVWERRKISVDKPEAWELLFGPGGLVHTAPHGDEGAKAILWSGDVGSVHMSAPPIHLACRFDGLNDALLLVELEPGSGSYSLGVWLSLYGVPEEQAAQLHASLNATLDRLFA